MISGRQSRRQRLDRETWAQYDTLAYDMTMRGRGEALTEEIYFGRAFSTPPTLTYSAVFDSVGADIEPQAIVPPRGAGSIDVDTYGLGNHSMLINPIIFDPGFEHQGQFISELGADARIIPDVHVFRETPPEVYTELQHVTHAWIDAGLPEGGYLDPGDGGYYRHADYNDNNWVQTDEQKARWEVSSDKSHDLGIGAAGKYSAKYVFPSNGSSNWLIPTDWYNGIYYLEPPNASYDKYSWVTSVTSASKTSSRGLKGDARTPGPPYMKGWDGFAYIWSDQDCEFEAGAHLWWEGIDDPSLDNGIDTVVAADDQMYGGSWDSPNEAHFRIIDDITQTANIVGGQWNKVDIHLPHSGSKMNPNWPPLAEYSYDSYWQLHYRINGGSTGQTVYLDNVYTWQIITNDVIPIMTIGVAEWITDEGGAYIGAKLWFKAGKP